MKKFFILLIAIAAGYLLYSYFQNKDNVEIKDNIVVTQPSGMDIHAGPAPPPKSAFIKGTIKNTGEKSLSNILLKYTCGYDTLSAQIGFLSPGQSAEFKTNICRVRNSNPQYSLKEIKYDEEEGF